MLERTSVMFVFFGFGASYDSSAYFWSFLLFFTHKTISMLNIIHVRFKIRITNTGTQIFVKILFVIFYIHPASLEEKPELSSPLMFQMFILSELVVQIQHARREELLLNCFNVFDIELELTIKLTLLNGGCADAADGFIHEGFELILDIIFKELLCLNSHFEDSFLQIAKVQIFSNINSRLDVRIDIPFLNVRSSLLKTCLSMFKWDFQVSCLIQNSLSTFLCLFSDFFLPKDNSGL